MGLAGRKTKQRIGADPRNLSWADDASKFGSAYLAKFGWDSSKGLGVAGDGRTTHVKVQHKLDMMGIGAAHMHDPNGIAWKQNRDFENLLKRLNEQTNGEGNGGTEEEEEEEEEGTKVEGFVSAIAVGEESKKKDRKDKKDKDKKKKKDRDDQEGKKSERKRKDKDDTEHKTKKRKKGANEEEEDPSEKPKTVEEESNVSIPKASETPQQVTQPVIPRHRAHRARAIAAKKMLSSSATAISEILGIAPTPSSSLTPSGSATPQGQLTTVDDDIVGEKITTSTKSVADYFKEKLLAKSSGQSGSMTPDTPDDAYDAPRGGLGSSRFKMNSGETTSNDMSGGMSKFASLMSSTFLAAASTTASAPLIPEDAPNNQEGREKAAMDDGDRSRKQKKNKKKQDKGAKDHGSEQPEEQTRKEKKRRKKEE